MASLIAIVFGSMWGISESYVISPQAISLSEGFRYSTLVPDSAHERFFDVEPDALRHPRRARTRLFEDGRRLGPPHRPHDYIRQDGGGQFSHWGETLYFSASDNSDPRSNGRIYRLVTSATLPVAAVLLWAACLVAPAALAMVPRLAPPPPAARGRFVPRYGPVILHAALCVVLIRSSLDPPSAGRLGGDRALTALWIMSLASSMVLAWRSGATLLSFRPAALREAGARWRERSGNLARPFARGGWRGLLARALTLAIPFGVFAAVLCTALPPQLLGAAYVLLTPVGIPAAVALLYAYYRRDWPGTVLGMTVTLALFALPLAALWQHIGIHHNAIAGLLPFSDAGGYYYDARRLLEGHPLGWSARRPLFVGLLATLLALTGQNLQVSVALFAAVNGVAAFLLAREVRASHGPAAAAAVTILLFLFYRVEGGSGTVLTENLGFAMGTVAFAALWRGSRENDARSIFTGMALLTIALMARAGAFFVLPAVVLAIGWPFRRRRAWLMAGGAVAAVAIAAGVTLVVGRLLANPASSQTTFSNFSYSLYGLVVGGQGWGQVLRDHPGAQEGGEIYALAWQAFRSHPLGIVLGSLKMWGTYFRPSAPYHAFAFVADGANSWLFQWGCYGLSALGLAVSVARLRQPTSLLLLAAVAGHVASIPFVPPVDAGLRVYAATLPALAILVSVGTAALLEWGRRGVLAALRRPTRRSPIAAAVVPTPRSAELFGTVLATVVLAGPLLVFYTGRPTAVENAGCPDGTPPVHVRLSSGAYARIVGNVPDVDDRRIAVPEIRVRDVARTVGGTEIRNDLTLYRAGSTMMNVHDLASGRLLWLVAPTALLPPPPAVLRVCGHPSSDPLSRSYAVFYADSVQVESGAGGR